MRALKRLTFANGIAKSRKETNLSFSSELKDELTKIKCARADERDTMLCAIAHTSAYMKFGSGRLSIEFVTENQATAELTSRLVAEQNGLSALLFTRRQEGLGKDSYIVSATGGNCKKMLLRYGCIPPEGAEDYVPGEVPDRFLLGERIAKCFIRGAFLGAGSISNPKKGYHLEIVCRYERFASIIRNLLSDFEINARVSRRNQNFIVYIKDGDGISDFLRLAGAVHAVLEFENIRVLRDTANKLNRISNFEDANMGKTAHASAQQLIDIRLIMDYKGLEFLPRTLRETAEARINNPEATLAELACELDIGKSGVNHRLAKLAVIAEDIRLHGTVFDARKGKNT